MPWNVCTHVWGESQPDVDFCKGFSGGCSSGKSPHGPTVHHTDANAAPMVLSTLWHCLPSGAPGTSHTSARPRGGSLVCRQPQHQPGTQQHPDHEGGEQHTRPGFLLSLSHHVALLSGRSMPEVRVLRHARGNEGIMQRDSPGGAWRPRVRGRVARVRAVAYAIQSLSG